MIKHEDGKWNVYTEDGSHQLGSHSSKQEAMKQLQAIEASKTRDGKPQPKHKKKQLGGT